MTQVWFLSDRENELSEWIDNNLEDTTYWFGRSSGNKRSIIVVFHEDHDEAMFHMRWKGVADYRVLSRTSDG